MFKKFTILDKKLIKIYPYINYETQMTIYNAVKTIIGKYENTADIIMQSKIVYDMCVVDIVSDYNIDEIKIDKNENGESISLNINEARVKEIEASGVIHKVTAKVSNYNEVWNNILKIIEIETNKRSTTKLFDEIPSAESLKDSLGAISEFISKNPEIVNTLSARAMEKNITNKVREERAVEKENKRKEKQPQ